MSFQYSETQNLRALQQKQLQVQFDPDAAAATLSNLHDNAVGLTAAPSAHNHPDKL